MKERVPCGVHEAPAPCLEGRILPSSLLVSQARIPCSRPTRARPVASVPAVPVPLPGELLPSVRRNAAERPRAAGCSRSGCSQEPTFRKRGGLAGPGPEAQWDLPLAPPALQGLWLRQPLPSFPSSFGGAGCRPVFQALFLAPPAFSGCMSEPVLWKTRQRK